MYSILFLLISYGLSIVANLPVSIENQILDWGCFFLLFKLALSTTRPKIVFRWIFLLNALATVIFIIQGGHQLFKNGVNGYIHENLMTSFGHQNMAAEFIGISIIIQLIGLQELRKIKKLTLKVSQLLLLFLSIAYLLGLSSRSAWVSLLAAVFILLMQLRFRVFRLLVLILSIFSILILFFITTRYSSNDLKQIKKQNIEIRLIRWANTLRLIHDHPIGIGPGNFEFGYVPYDRAKAIDPESHEDSVVRSPHNGFLELAAENGWLSLVALVLLIFYLSVSVFKRERREVRFFGFFAILVFVLTDAFFAFPMETAYPFYVLAVFLGLGLRGKNYVNQSKIPFLLLVGLTCILVTLFVYSKVVEAIEERNQMMAWSCKLFPSNWRNCATQIEFYLAEKKFEVAEELSRDLLRKNQNNFVILQLHGISILNQNRHEEACRVLSKYEQLLHHESSTYQNFVEECNN